MCHKAAVELPFRLSSSGCYFSIKNHILNKKFNQASCDTTQLYASRKFSLFVKNSTVSNNVMYITNLRIQNEMCSRLYCSRRERELPKIMDFPQVVWPSVFKTIRNWVLSNFIIMRYFDSEFTLPDFVSGSKQAVEVVSSRISEGDVEGLRGLVTPEVISQVTDSLKTFSLKQRQEFAIKKDDIFFAFPYEVGVMFPNEEKNEGENQSRFVEITMCYHAMIGLQELKESGTQIPMNLNVHPEYHEKIFILNYRFIREFTKGVQGGWTINAINHFKPVLSVS